MSGSNVYTGFWINWTFGRVKGSTITLSARDTALLGAFVAVFVTAAGPLFWRISCFLLHQKLATPSEHDTLHHEIQVALRNSGGALGTLWEFIKGCHKWRKKAARPYRRLLPLAFLALLNAVFFSAAGILSVLATRAASKQFLLSSPTCGFYMNLTKSNIDTSQADYPTYVRTTLQTFAAVTTNDSVNAASYARLCYGNASDPFACKAYVQPKLTSFATVNVSCPFASGTCYGGENSAFQVDTGYLDSQVALGINAPKTDRVLFRRVTTCAVLHSTGHISAVNASSSTGGVSGDSFAALDYGPLSDAPNNYTYLYNLHTPADDIGYQLSAVSSYTNWNPTTDFVRNDGVVTLLFLALNDVQSYQPITDPWFSSTTPHSVRINDTITVVYTSDVAVNVLGCVDQFQYCDPNSNSKSGVPSKCTPLNDKLKIYNDIGALGLNIAQLKTADRISTLSIEGDVFSQVYNQRENALRARETVQGGLTQSPLPNNQWQIEVQYWFNTALARLQMAVHDAVLGPPNITNLTRMTEDQGLNFCRQQLTGEEAGFQNFSVLGLGLVVGSAFCIIVLGLTLPELKEWTLKMLGQDSYALQQWKMDEKLELLRLAQKDAVQGSMTRSYAYQPVSEQEGTLITVPTSNIPVPAVIETDQMIMSQTGIRYEGMRY